MIFRKRPQEPPRDVLIYLGRIDQAKAWLSTTGDPTPFLDRARRMTPGEARDYCLENPRSYAVQEATVLAKARQIVPHYENIR